MHFGGCGCGFGFRVLGFEIWVLGLGFEFWVLGFVKVLGFWVRVVGWGFGSGIRVHHPRAERRCRNVPSGENSHLLSCFGLLAIAFI